MRIFSVAVVCAAALSVTLPAQQGASAVRRAARPVPSQYIVVLRAAEDPVAVAAETSNRFGGRVRHLYRAALRGFAVRLPAAAAEALARDPRVRFVEEEPLNTWKQQQSSEYGFYANVNPQVDHPRWSQGSERRLGEFFRRKTLMFNGYGDQVASLYNGMDLRKFY